MKKLLAEENPGQAKRNIYKYFSPYDVHYIYCYTYPVLDIWNCKMNKAIYFLIDIYS